MDSCTLSKNKKNCRTRKIVVYIITAVLSLAFIILGNRLTLGNVKVFSSGENTSIAKARITKVIDKTTEKYTLDGVSELTNEKIIFSAEIMAGKNKGQTVEGVQNIDALIISDEKEVEKGDVVVLSQLSEGDEVFEWVFTSYYRINALLGLAILFGLLLVVFGKLKGVNTIVSLGFICAAVFAVFIPAILSGQNIYIWTIIISAFTIVMTLIIVNGPDFKTLTAILGCVSGVIVSGIITLIMSNVMHLTGIIDEDSMFLVQMSEHRTIDLRAIIFASILIGALGAVMDVSMSVASSLWEVADQACAPSRKQLFSSGINIGRDMMATMSSTLILAYIGSSLPTVLLLIAYQPSLMGLMNLEMIVVEVLQALAGSIGILFTIPLTSLIASILFAKMRKAPVEISEV